MLSPFFYRHVGILLLVLANLALSIYAAVKARRTFNPARLLRSIVFRSAALLYFITALFAVVVAVPLFLQLEISDEARQAWSRSRQWTKVNIGMTRKQVQQLVGPGEHQWAMEKYTIHPLHPGYAYVEYDADPDHGKPMTDESKVKSKDPMGEEPWLPQPMISSFWHDVDDTKTMFGVLGVSLLAVLSLIPLSLRAGWNSWQLYLPVAGALLAYLYESAQRGGWRFDLMLFYPAYFVIAASWAFRAWFVVKSLREGGGRK